ncbi:BPL-N domain-containing protein [Amycolatopsis sp. NPDC049252]|uniref:BPL-N domain-containing protein n=1 Tax=Amycolatopsis sp. NPDC049252 TaxID=3363933 RepID=UPI00371A6741
MRPLALVYRGPATLPGCPEAVADLLRASKHGFDVRFAGPDEKFKVGAAALAGAALYAQPGGGTLGSAYRKLRRHRDDIRAFVEGGGRYLGFCLGGYLAGATPGFGLLPGDTDRYIDTEGATVDHDDDTVVKVRWRGRGRRLYFQDGPVFLLERPDAADVLATYSNGTVAALVAPFGAGRVGVVGPHPEATRDWYADGGLRPPLLRYGHDLGLDLVDSVMAR